MSDDRSSAYEYLKTWILQLPGVTMASHKLGGTEFRVNGVGFMHSHGSSVADILLSKSDQAAVVRTGMALRHRAQMHDQEGWVSYRIENSQDLVNARKVIMLAYENAKKESIDTKTK